MTIHETDLRRAKPQHGIGYFFRPTESLGTNVTQQFCFYMRITLNQFFRHRTLRGMVALALANASAKARPIPAAAPPVTITTFLFIVSIISVF